MISFGSEHPILVTGAGSGIGASAALLCNSLGASVIACARDKEKLASVQASAAKPDRFYIETRDLAENMEDLPAWAGSLAKKFGKFAGFVHCAGYNMMAPFKNYDLAEARKMLDIHFHSAMLLARGVTDRRNHAKPCSCVFMSSICAVTPLRMLTIYAAAKGALLAAARCMSKELSSQQIRVNCISPALVRTAMTEDYSNVVMGFDVLEKEDEIYPLGISEPKDIANTIAFLLSDASRKMTGQNICIEGGRH